MGKHSNLIFCQEDNTILDSIKHISANMSSVREVLPGRTWFIPHTQDKKDPLTITEEEFFDFVCTKPMAAAKASAEGIRAIKENKHFGVKSLQAHHADII